MIAVFLANGFEEIEALAVVDILRRAGLDVQTIGVASKTPLGAHGIPVVADILDSELDLSNVEVAILPGGMPGTLNLEKSDVVQAALRAVMDKDGMVAAICAAPSILDHAGYLVGKDYICYPGFESVKDGRHKVAPVVTDGNVITGRGPGAAISFALELVSVLVSPDKASEIAGGMQCL